MAGEQSRGDRGDGHDGRYHPGLQRDGDVDAQNKVEDSSVNVFEWVAKTRLGGQGVSGGVVSSKGNGSERGGRRGGGKRRSDERFVDEQGRDAEQQQAKIRAHAVEAMEEEGVGEEMILTLADRGVLEEEEGDVLENVREAELQRNALGRKRAEKAKPLWEEDGVKRGLLDKYDEEEAEATYVLGGVGSGVVGVEKRGGERMGTKRMGGDRMTSQSVKARLEEAKMSLLGMGMGMGGDYYTAEELGGRKKKKKKEKEQGGERTNEDDGNGDDGNDEGIKKGKNRKSKNKTGSKNKQRRLKKKALTADEIAEMEAAVGEEGPDGGDATVGGDGAPGASGASNGGVSVGSSRHLGSREERAARVAAQAGAEQAARAKARGRFDAALAKANLKSVGLRKDRPGEEEAEEEEEEEEEALAASMAKARALAMKSKSGSAGLGASVEDVAKRAIARREKGGEGVKEDGGLTFTDVGEFARSIATRVAKGDEDRGDGGDDVGGAEYMDVDVKEEVEEAVEEKKGRGRKRYRKHGDDAGEGEQAGGLVKEEGMVDEKVEEEMATNSTVVPSAADTNKLGPGLGSVLSLLKDRGELNKSVEWGGRANDSRNSFFTSAMGGYKDVYTGGRTDDNIAANVEVALTRKDEFGRVMTPKEAFRQFCHSFHGIQPSQNSKEKRLRQAQKELAQKRRDAGLGGDASGRPPPKRDTPFVSLDGTKVKPGQRRE